ncbi:MAG TPA: protease inhibitor I42 family protein [Myxococcaceae bacterium]|nr:protease inhibitor I42 family protein [Myxococcaceae bacterium]
MAKAKAAVKKIKPGKRKPAKKKAKSGKKAKAARRGTQPAKPAAKAHAVSAPPPRQSKTAAARKVDFPEFASISPGKSQPRATKLPPTADPLNKREMEELLTAGQGRGVSGEGSLKGRLLVREGFPYLQVMGRDKRELLFLLQGPDQEVLPAYVDHKVSVSGYIKKSTNYGGVVDVRKYSAKKPGHDVAPASVEEKLKFLSPGELEQIAAAGMGAGMKGFGTLRGNLEMTGEEFFLVVSNAGTRQQVSFLLQGRGAKGLRKHVGQTLQVTGVVEKSSGWGGTVQVESFEPRLTDHRSISRENLEIVQVEGPTDVGETVEAKLNQGLAVRLPERPGFTWAIEPTTAKRMGLREANYEPANDGPARREFFFTPRNPGAFEIDFFLAKAFNPSQVSKTFKLGVVVKP